MVSRRRNEEIADMFHEVHFVEKWGREISLILSKEPDTEFKEVGTQFIAVFKRKELEKVGEKVTKSQHLILKFMSENPTISIVQLSKKVGIAEKKHRS